MQETLLGELSAARRVLLHGQLAEVFERLYGEARDTLAATAEHYRESAALNSAHARSAARYLRLAAESAAAALAYDEAARLYEQCLELVTAAPDRLEEDEAALRHNLGMALREAGDWPAGHSELGHALALHREKGDGAGFARTALEALALYMGRPRSEREPIALEALTLAPTREAWAALAVSYVQPYFDPSSEALAREARAVAQASALTDQLAQLAYREGDRALLEGRYEEGIAALRDAAAMGVLPVGPRFRMDSSVGQVELARGRVNEALAAFRDSQVRADHARFAASQGGARSSIAGIHLLRSDLTSAGADLDTAEEFTRNGSVALTRARLCALSGELDAAIAALTTWMDSPSPIVTWVRALRVRYLMLRRGASDANVRIAFAAFMGSLSEWDTAKGIPDVIARAAGIEAIVEIGNESDVRDAYALLQQRPAAVGFEFASGDALDRLRGVLALRLDILDEAEGYFRRGLAMCERERCPIEAGRCHQGLAEVAERRGQHLEAMQHLDAAGELFARHGAKLYLDQVIAKKQILKA